MEKKLRSKLPGGKFQNVDPKRSRVMSRIHGKHTQSTERVLRMALVRTGVRGWRMYEKNLPGMPDIYFPKHKIAVFVDGCFWHGCPTCGHFPKTNSAFWRTKILRNRQRDSLVRYDLSHRAIRVIRIWEHTLQTLDGLLCSVEGIVKLMKTKASDELQYKEG